MSENEYGFEPNNEPSEPTEPIVETTASPVEDAPKQNEQTAAYESYQANNAAQNNFNRYCDPVDETKASEPAYSPYSNQQYNQSAQQNNSYSQYGPYQSNAQQNGVYSAQVEAPAKKKVSGFKVFIAIVVVIAFITSIIFALSVKSYKNNTSDKKPQGDTTQIKISESEIGTSSKNSVEIAGKAQKFNVGILLYGKKQTLGGSASNALAGEGSGIIMGEDKSKTYTYIITCAHVINKVATSGYEMTVQDCDGNTYEGEMVGYDSKTDIGVIKIKKTGLTAAEFGDSSKLVIGQQVYAIGNPGGVEFFGSFTNGMISAIDRPINSESGYEMKCIQHTTPINSGNSGGALLNEAGQVIGINSSKIVSTGYEGMAFSIPITDAKPIIDDIISNGYVTNRPKLGISYRPASAYRDYSMLVAFKELPAGSLVIEKIYDSGSLANTKAKVGDMIIAVDGEDLTTADVLLDKIENGKVGDTLKLTLCRVGDNYSVEKFTIDVKLVEDKGTVEQEETTEQQTTPSEDDFYNFFFGGGY